MAWSIAQVARMSKVTSRTLRHYHQIGLLPPARVGVNGYRYYEREQLLRLQEILLLRQLGLGLDTIGEIVHRGQDRVAALRLHHRELLAERDRFQRLADTVAATIGDLEGGDTEMVKVDHWFDGLDSRTEARYRAEAERRWGAEVVEQTLERRSRLDAADMTQQWVAILRSLVELIEAGAAPDDSRVYDVLDRHYQWLAGYWTPNRESYAGLGELYADEPGFREKFDATHPRLAEFLRDAMARYARARLS